MLSRYKSITPYVILVLLLLTIDQVTKIWVKTNMRLGEEIFISPWFRIHFTENPGMAFGILIGGETGKMLLSIIRIILFFFFSYLLYKEIQRGAPKLIIIGLAFIIAGAAGNLVDSLFYGILFTESTYWEVARFDPSNGYSSFLHGKVVDMLFFPIWQGELPEWMPFIGGEYFIFFEPIFNLADTFITVGFIMWLVGSLFFDKRQQNDTTSQTHQL